MYSDYEYSDDDNNASDSEDDEFEQIVEYNKKMSNNLDDIENMYDYIKEVGKNMLIMDNCQLSTFAEFVIEMLEKN
jgi:cystathionine beta-lyase family protein involved in aluminum resistance